MNQARFCLLPSRSKLRGIALREIEFNLAILSLTPEKSVPDEATAEISSLIGAVDCTFIKAGEKFYGLNRYT